MSDAIYSLPAWPFTIVAALIAILGALFVQRHLLFRNAAIRFRSSINNLQQEVPEVSKHWTNEVLASLPELVKKIGVSVNDFEPFLSDKHKNKFIGDWEKLKQHCEENIPKALSAAEVLYGGGQRTGQDAKEQFYVYINTLLSYTK